MANVDDKKTASAALADQTPKHLPQLASDEQFRLMVEELKEYAFFMLGPQGHVLSWNAGAEQIEGYRAEEIIGKHFSLFYMKEEVKSGMPQRELEIASAAGSMDVTGWRLRKDGSRFWAAVTITSLHDREGNITGFSKVIRDINERRDTEEVQLKRCSMFERLFETAPDAVVVVDPSGMIRRVNQQAEVIFGFMREELIGHRIEQLIPERYHRRHRQLRHNYFTDPRARKMGIGLELFGHNQDGREIPVDIMLTPIETSEGIWAVAAIRDISRQKRTESKIAELHAALQSQVEQLALSNRELEAFSYSVSHDLRAPLRHVIGFIDLLNAKSHEALDDKSRHYLQVISEAAKRMGELIDDLLEFSRMGRSEMMKTTVNFNLVVAEIVKELSVEAKGREIEWHISPLPLVLGDSAMLRQVMINLITNALKFTRPRTPAKITIGAVDEERETRFYVMDNGVGFDEAYINKLFGLFQRLHTMEEFEGTGVGLAIVQRIVMRHGGRVWAEGSVQGGATFWFSLPKAELGVPALS
jgi:PAS domain S-box-containing protein